MIGPEVDALWSALGIRRAYKTANEIVNNSITLQDDDHLKVPVAADTYYIVLAWLRYQANSTPDIKFAFTAPSGTTIAVHTYTGYPTSNTFTQTHIIALATGMPIAGVTGSNNGTIVIGHALTASVSGTLQLQWAQNTLDASNTTVYLGSWLACIPLS